MIDFIKSNEVIEEGAIRKWGDFWLMVYRTDVPGVSWDDNITFISMEEFYKKYPLGLKVEYLIKLFDEWVTT